MENHHHFWQFAWDVFNNWAGYFTGGGIMAIITFWHSWKGNRMKRKILIAITILFFAMGAYKAWEEQYGKTAMAENNSDNFKRIANEYRHRFNFLSDALLNANITNRALSKVIADSNKQSPIIQANQASNIVMNTDYSMKKVSIGGQNNAGSIINLISDSPGSINTIGQTGGSNTLVLNGNLPQVISSEILRLNIATNGAFTTLYKVRIANIDGSISKKLRLIPNARPNVSLVGCEFITTDRYGSLIDERALQHNNVFEFQVAITTPKPIDANDVDFVLTDK